MKNLIHQKLDSEENGFTEHYVPIRKQHQENRDTEMSARGSAGKTARKPGKTGKARSYDSADSYAR